MHFLLKQKVRILYIFHTFVLVRLLYIAITGYLSVLGTKQTPFISKVDCKVRDGVNGSILITVCHSGP